MLRFGAGRKTPDAFVKAEGLQRLPVFRRFLLLEALVYFLWYWVIKGTSPEAFNPILNRAVIWTVALSIYAASYFSDFVARHIDKFFYASLYLLMTENAYANYMNHADVTWPVATYVTIIATCACIQSRRALLPYAIYTFLVCTLVSYGHGFMYDFYVPGVATILLVSNLALAYQHRTVRALADVTERLEQIFHATFEGICIHDQGIILDVNESFARMFGYSRAELIDTPIARIVAPRSNEIVRERIRRYNESSYQAWGVRKNGEEFPVEVAAKKHNYENREVRFITVRDISERLQAERDRERRIEALAAVKLRDQFISIASHELKTPLTPLKLSNDILTEIFSPQTAPSPLPLDEIREYLRTNDAQLSRINRLIENMLDVSRISSGNFALALEDFDLREVGRGTIAAFAEEARKTRSPLSMRTPRELTVRWDRLRIEQVLCNLLKNALIYAPGKAVSLSMRELKNGCVALRVRDHGPGIAHEDLTRIFERFERAVSARHYGGLGLGLYISDQIVKAHQGQIRVKSRVGRGTSFTLVIPSHPAPSTVLFARNY